MRNESLKFDMLCASFEWRKGKSKKLKPNRSCVDVSKEAVPIYYIKFVKRIRGTFLVFLE
jgi:hypothetical protein